MANIFFTSDWHLGHQNILTFKRQDGSAMRNFSNVEEMHEYMIERHNSVVSANDKVYVLGDVCFTNKWLHLVDRFNGEKVLIKGNHDTLKLHRYAPYFKDVRGIHQFKGVVMTHIPIHPDSLSRWGVNIHGHLHTNFILRDGEVDDRYHNVSVEVLNDYTPISLEEIKALKNLT
jgi:calcineurin-like phosphoesterase family protein